MSRRLELAAIVALVFAYVFLVQPSGDNQKAHLALVRALADGVPYVDEQVRSPELASVNFEVVGYGVVATQVADSSGIIQAASVPLPALNAGTYSVRSTGVTSGRTNTSSVQVSTNPAATPTPPGSNVPVTPVTQTGVRKWVVQDPAPGGLGTYTFPINPTRMAPPHAPRTPRTPSGASGACAPRAPKARCPGTGPGLRRTDAVRCRLPCS